MKPIYHITSTSNEVVDKSEEKQNSYAAKLDDIAKQKKELLRIEGDLLEKGIGSNDPDLLIKASTHFKELQQQNQNQDTKSLLVDPNDWNSGQGFKQSRFNLNHMTLRRMAATPIIRSIISTRQTQVSAFSSPQKGRYDTGFVIRKKREYYTEEEPKVSSKDKLTIKYITDFLLNGGTEQNKWHGDDFDSFLKKITRDALELDQACFEVVQNKKNFPTEFLAVDGGTICIADNERHLNIDNNIEEIDGYYPSHVQVFESQIIAEYYPWELCFGIRNSQTDIRMNGYGKSEVQELMNIITWMLYSDTYNGKFFSQGSNPKGLLKVNQGVNRNRVAEFRQQWMSMVAGVQNAWKIPIIESDKMEWIDLQKNNTDMEFAKWQEYLIKVSCAIFKIAPEEIGFDLGNAGGGGGMFESNNEQRLKYSRDKGLKPLLKSLEFWINKWIVSRIDPTMEFKFVGMDTDSEEREVDLDIKKVGNFMGFKEIRRKYNLPEELEEGDFILNPIYAQIKQQEAFAEEQEGATDFVDEDSEEDVWNQLDADDLVKGVLRKPELIQYQNNPMMIDAINMLIDEK